MTRSREPSPVDSTRYDIALIPKAGPVHADRAGFGHFAVECSDDPTPKVDDLETRLSGTLLLPLQRHMPRRDPEYPEFRSMASQVLEGRAHGISDRTGRQVLLQTFRDL